jgi:hypothetical protein
MGQNALWFLMPICKICQSLDRSGVDDALAGGVTVRDVASQFAFSKSAIGRHRAACLAPRIAAAARIVAPAAEVRRDVEHAKAIVSGALSPTAGDVLSLSGLLDRLGRSLERLERSADSAADDKLHGALAAVSAQLHRGIETSAKIQGLYAEQPQIDGPRFSISIIIPSSQPNTLPLSINTIDLEGTEIERPCEPALVPI